MRDHRLFRFPSPARQWASRSGPRARKMSRVAPWAALLSGMLAAPAMAEDDISIAKANATANFTIALTVEKLYDMNFGTVRRPNDNRSTTIRLGTSGGVSSDTDSGLIVSGSGARAGVVRLTGDPRAAFVYSGPATVVLSNGEQDIVVTLTRSSVSTLPNGGITTFNFGGTFNFDRSYPLGVYSGSFQASFRYN